MNVPIETAVELTGVKFSYNGEPVLDSVNLTVPRNDFLAVIGPNGGGKTTLLKLVAGLIAPDRGDIRVFGEPPSRAALRFGYVPQNTAVDPDFPVTVFDVTLMGRLGHPKRFRRFTAADRAAADRALDEVGMGALRGRRIGELSGGQRQRVFLARALACEPDILLLDEPTASIDAEGQRMIYALLKRLSGDITVVTVSHDLTLLLGYASSVAYVNRTLHHHRAPLVSADILSRFPSAAADHFCPVELLEPRNPGMEN